MNYFKLILSYNGFHYHGWQFQTTQQGTIQEVFEKVLRKVLGDDKAKTMAASRTDARVHAQGQVLKVTTINNMVPSLLLERLNFNLPPYIKVKSIAECAQGFNPIRNTAYKEYHYFFSEKKIENPLLAETVYYVKNDLNIEAMKTACSIIKGINDFKHFHVPGSRTPHTKREILNCEISQENFLNQERFYIFKIKGDGFLKYMVRIIMYFLLEVGQDKITLEEFKNIFTTKRKIQKVPAHGLHLINIHYK